MTGETLTDGVLRAENERARRVAARLSLAGGLLTVVVGLAITGVAGSLPLAYQYVPLALSVVVLGFPHGAVDHLVVPRARGDPVTARSFAAIGLLYLVVGGAYAVVWVLAPVVAFVLFILMTLVHWGQGDVYALVELFSADHLTTRTSRLLTLLVRGGLPMIVPLIAFPEQYAFVAGTLVGAFDPGAAAALEPAFTPRARATAAVGFGALTATTLAFGFVQAGDDGLGSWTVDAVETVGLLAYFALVPPILAIGLYFCFWHALRHVLRTMLVDDVAKNALDGGAVGAASLRFARDAAPLTAGGLLVFVGVWVVVPEASVTAPDVIAVYLITIAVLTLPHVVVVALLDREQGIWC